MVGKRTLTAKRLVSPSNAAGVVYGVITVGALMAAESGRHESFIDALASAVFATLLYWLAHAYADLLGRRLDTGDRLTARALAQALAHDWASVRGRSTPGEVLLKGAVGVLMGVGILAVKGVLR